MNTNQGPSIARKAQVRPGQSPCFVKKESNKMQILQFQQLVTFVTMLNLGAVRLSLFEINVQLKLPSSGNGQS
jgi:hypothetical protein